MVIPILSLAIGGLLIWAAITGQNPLLVLKSVLTNQPITTGATRNPKPLN
jgi:hypothetical protein